MVVHPRWIDRLPFPKMRDSLIRLRGAVEEERLLQDLFCMPTWRFREGMACWDPWAWVMERGWKGQVGVVDVLAWSLNRMLLIEKASSLDTSILILLSGFTWELLLHYIYFTHRLSSLLLPRIYAHQAPALQSYHLQLHHPPPTA